MDSLLDALQEGRLIELPDNNRDDALHLLAHILRAHKDRAGSPGRGPGPKPGRPPPNTPPSGPKHLFQLAATVSYDGPPFGIVKMHIPWKTKG